jgi:hypothetical protein
VKIYKVVKKIGVDGDVVRRRRVSSSVRHKLFLTEYPPGEWVKMRLGPSFVFVDEEEARLFLVKHEEPGRELWYGESEDIPARILRMANSWRWIELFWLLKDQGNETMFHTISMACPEAYYGVWKLRLFNRIG